MDKEVRELFLKEKIVIAETISEWFFKLVVWSSLLRIVTGLINLDFSARLIYLSVSALAVFLPIWYLTRNNKKSKVWLAFLLVWGFEPIAQYYAFWLYPQYDILYAMANTTQFYYCIAEMAFSFNTGILAITMHTGL